jgi:hypothetical protein
MRLWTLHPCYLDVRGLCGLWREALLAQKVLRGETKGYRNHPQLTRFLAHPQPLEAISTYLLAVYAEGEKRGYRFDREKILTSKQAQPIPAARGQLLYEWAHLQKKLELRAPELFVYYQDVSIPEPHPLFTIVEGDVESWEIQKSD